MRSFALAMLLLISCAAVSKQDSQLHNISDLQWQNRIIVINDLKDPDHVVEQLTASAADIDERDIAWFLINDSKLQTNYSGETSDNFAMTLQRKLSISTPSVVLIGKDGGIKSRAATLDLTAIFSEIDSMPMRQQEMRKQ